MAENAVTQKSEFGTLSDIYEKKRYDVLKYLKDELFYEWQIANRLRFNSEPIQLLYQLQEVFNVRSGVDFVSCPLKNHYSVKFRFNFFFK